MIVTEREREREAETQAEGEAGSMHREPDVGFDPGCPGSRSRPKAGAKPLRHLGIPISSHFNHTQILAHGALPLWPLTHFSASPRGHPLQEVPLALGICESNKLSFSGLIS